MTNEQLRCDEWDGGRVCIQSRDFHDRCVVHIGGKFPQATSEPVQNLGYKENNCANADCNHSMFFHDNERILGKKEWSCRSCDCKEFTQATSPSEPVQAQCGNCAIDSKCPYHNEANSIDRTLMIADAVLDEVNGRRGFKWKDIEDAEVRREFRLGSHIAALQSVGWDMLKCDKFDTDPEKECSPERQMGVYICIAHEVHGDEPGVVQYGIFPPPATETPVGDTLLDDMADKLRMDANRVGNRAESKFLQDVAGEIESDAPAVGEGDPNARLEALLAIIKSNAKNMVQARLQNSWIDGVEWALNHVWQRMPVFDEQPTAGMANTALFALNELRKKHVVEPEYVPGAGGLLAIIEAALTATDSGEVERCYHEKNVNLGDAHFYIGAIGTEVSTMLRCLDCTRISIDGGDVWLSQPASKGGEHGD